jgi:hypothetical protein
MREYQKYLNQINALQTTGTRPFAMPVSACMDQFSKRRIALCDLYKDHNEVTESEWQAWFMEAADEDPVDLDVLRKRLTAVIRFDTRLMDANSRVGHMLDELMKALEQDHQEWVLYQEGKAVVDIMTKAIKPTALRDAVQKQMTLQRNKPLKTDVFRFVKWLRTYAAGYQMFFEIDDDVKSSAPPKSLKPAADPKSGSEGKPGGGGAKPDAPKPKIGDKPRAKLGCLKSGSAEHRVADCPDVKPGEAERLLEAQVKKWKDANASVKSLGDTSKCQSAQRGVFEGAVPISNVLTLARM